MNKKICHHRYTDKSSIHQAVLIILSVAIYSSLSLIAIKQESLLLKVFATLSLIYSIIFSFYIINKKSFVINKYKTILFISLFLLIPFSGMCIAFSKLMTFKNLTDTFISENSEYYLVIPALALSTLYGSSLFTALQYLAPFFLPISIGLLIIQFQVQASISKVELGNDDVQIWGYTTISNFILPISLLLFSSLKKYFYTGLFFLFIGFLACYIVNARSYLIVFFLISFLAFFKKYKFTQLIRIVFPIAFASYIIYSIVSVIRESIWVNNDQQSIIDKFHLDTLGEALYKSYETFQIKYLFFWEGNSRSDILVDAFNNFTIYDWLFGRNVDGTYVSFIERHVIELFWAQEIFNWGIFYTIVEMGIYITSIVYLFKKFIKSRNDTFFLAFAAVVVKFIDNYIYGISHFSVYSLFVMSSILILTRNNNETIN